MQAIGIAQERPLIYEGDGRSGYGLWPSPAISLATILTSDDESDVPSTTNLFVNPMVFREDSFDPVTRIRRGRIYRKSSDQPRTWRVQQHPAYLVEEGQGPAGWIRKDLFTFEAWSARNVLPRSARATKVVLGTSEASTQWLIVDVERIVTGEDLITLRARAALGILPELDEKVIPPNLKDRTLQLYENLLGAAYRSGAESVIDRARDLAQWSVGVYLSLELENPKLLHDDLAELAKRVPDDKHIVKGVVSSLARLHARCKPNVQEQHRTRSITESDAEFALSGIGILLRELKWAI